MKKTTYKLFRLKNDTLYPLFVESDRAMPVGEWIDAGTGEKIDDKHVKSRLGALSLRPGFHSTEVPFTDWIGKRQNGVLVQRKNTVWCECEIEGKEQKVSERYGLRILPNDWYYYKTKPNQLFPWIISNRIRIVRILSYSEVVQICARHGVKAQAQEE